MRLPPPLTPEEKECAARFAQTLKDERKRRRLSQTDLGALIKYDRRTVGRYESGRYLPPLDWARALDEALGISLFASLLPHPQVEQERQERLTKYVDIEQNVATALKQLQVQVVPALLQTERYARTVLAASIPQKGPVDIDRMTLARLKRQEVFNREDPLPAHFVLDEGAARRLMGGPALMVEQWKHLLASIDNPYITVQVLPHAEGAHAALLGSYTLLETVTQGDVLYMETMVTGTVVTDIPEVGVARQIFDSLMARALSPAGTRAFLEGLIKKEGRT
ncbi:helix-turn-helix transcriptional regulator [Nocardiopsis sp. NPDC006198]|uniref:helix-turn-helix domain-containing protein n=1 Tax=Nocardiopsis sp. NPDC006198 TaxID=3154472 RepID=UPI0033AE7980